MVKRAALLLLRAMVTTLSVAVTLVLFAAVMASVFLATQTGREWAITSAAPWAAEQAGFSLRFQGVQSPGISQLGAEEISVSKEGELLFSARGFFLHWSPMGVYRQLHIHHLRANEITVVLPQDEADHEEDVPNDDAPFQLPQWDYPVAIEKLEVARLILRHPQWERQQAYHLQGDLHLLATEAPLEVNLAARSLEGPSLRLAVSTTAESEDRWRLSVKLEEAAGGLVAGLLKLPEERPLEMFMSSVMARTESGWDVTLEELEADYDSHRLAGFARLAVDTGEPAVTIHEGHLLIDDSKPQEISGRISNEALALTVKLTDFPLQLIGQQVEQDIDGVMSGEMGVTGTPSAPVVAVDAVADGVYADQPFTLKADVDYARANLQVGMLEFDMEGARLSAKGTLKEEVMDFDIAAQGVPTDILALSGWRLHPGKFTLNASLKGTAEKPEVNGTADYDTRFTTWERERRTLPLQLKLEFETREAVFHAQMNALQNSRQVGSATMVLPLQPYMDMAFAGKNELAGSMKGNLDLQHVSLFLDRALHKIQGNLTFDAALGGTLDNPQIDGEISIDNGLYESRVASTTLHDINARITATGQRIRIEKASATDGNGGTFALQGHVDWSDTAMKTPINLTLEANRANIINREDIVGYATGELNLKGDWEQAKASGTVDVTPFTLLLDTFLSQEDIPSIEVTEVYAGQEAQKPQDVATLLPEILLDITLRADKQAFLRGYGVDAELEGEIRLVGTLAEPEISGVIKTVRGHYEVLGKRFELREGRVEFQGESMFLMIPGVYERRGQEIRAVLSGSVDDLQIEFTSMPPMPEDEIVSWLLFGKSASNISPFQAIRLANAVAALRGGGKALFDPVDEIRDLLNLDEITVDGSESGGTDVTVGVGKYISDRVYLELEKGSDPTQPVKGSVEIELRPNLSLESETGGDAGLGGVQLQWKRDY